MDSAMEWECRPGSGDGLAVLRLRQMHQPSRKHLIELAMTTARAELTPDTGAVS